MPQDEEHLRLLSIFHYVVAGLAALFSLFPIFHVAIGLAIALRPQTFAQHGGNVPPAFFGWMFVVIGALFILMGFTFAICTFIAGRSLSKRKRYTYCLVMAGIECMFIPFGTVLGVFTLIVLLREPVKALFGENQRALT